MEKVNQKEMELLQMLRASPDPEKAVVIALSLFPDFLERFQEPPNTPPDHQAIACGT